MKSSKPTTGRKLWVMASFLKTSIYDSCMSHTYAIYIFSGSEFCGEFSENIFGHAFFESAHAKLWKFIFSEMRGRKFFSFSNSKATQKSTSNDIHLYKIYPTHAHVERNFKFWRVFDAYAWWKYFSKAWNCDHHVRKVRLPQKKSEIKCIWTCL